jgi:O-antigen ligase
MERTTTALKLERFVFVAFASALALFPLFYGGNRDWAWASLLICFSLLNLVLLWRTPYLQRLQVLLKAQRWMLPTLLAWLAFQIITLLSSNSADWGASLRSTLKSTLYLQAILLTWVLVRSRDRARYLLLSLFTIALLHATFACVFLLWGKAIVSEYFVFGAAGSMGSFVNKNHFAGYLEIHLGIGAGLLLSGLKFGPSEPLSIKQRLRSAVRLLLDRKTQLRLGMIILVIALVLTRSRMGNIAFFVSLLISGALAFFVLKKRPPTLGILLVSIVFIDLVVVGSWFGARQLAERIGNTRIEFGAEQVPEPKLSSSPVNDFRDVKGISSNSEVLIDRERPGVTKAALQMFQSAPWVGLGGGSFRTAFPEFRPQEVSDKFYDHAHNDWAQILAEFGIVGAALVAILLGSSYINLLVALRQRSNRTALGTAFAACCGMTAILIHGFADFNLQIPGNALLFSVLFALTTVSRFGLYTKTLRSKESVSNG